MNALLLLTALAVNPQITSEAVDRVSLVEVAHIYDGQANRMFDLVIWYDWSHKDGRHQVRDWRLLSRFLPKKGMWPIRTPGGEFVSEFDDQGIYRRVIAGTRRESWMQADVEYCERAFVAKDERRFLSKPPCMLTDQ